MRPQEISEKLDELYIELKQIQNMHAETVCKKYNVDLKEEAIEALKDEIRALENYEGEDYEEYDMWDDHGFRDEADYIAYKFGA